jgi:hypothetical protein
MHTTDEHFPLKPSIYVLLDEPDSIAEFGGPVQIDADRLGDQLQAFTEAMSRAFSRCHLLAGEFMLTEIELEAKLTAEFGFMFVSKAGVEGAVTLKFARRDRKLD